MKRIEVFSKPNQIARWAVITFFFFIVWLPAGERAYGGAYLESAHGNRTTGVNRRSMSVERGHGYGRGNCAHCHEQHGSIMGEAPHPSGGPNARLTFEAFYWGQGEGLCLSCHHHPNESKQLNMPFQYSYSYKFGGDTRNSCPRHVRESFVFIDESGIPTLRCDTRNGSAHQLSEIRTFLAGKWGFSPYSDNINPCSGCHNPHMAQRHAYPVGRMGSSPLALPSTYNRGWALFGAQPSQRMDRYPYQPPYFYYTTIPSGYEPNGRDNNWGGNVPDYVTFCTECHQVHFNDNGMQSQQKRQFAVGASPWIQNPDWAVSPHGSADGAGNDQKNRKDPFKAPGNYVLSCTDCHEPHGSPNRMLIRKTVNGQSLVQFTDWQSRSDWATLCERCHALSRTHYEEGGPCSGCHLHDPNARKPF